MKLKSLLFICFMGLMSCVFAANRQVHPQAGAGDVKAGVKNAMSLGFCEIEIINDSSDNVNVNGSFDDGSYMNTFSIYSYDEPQYVSLFYYGYCHQGMTIWVDTFSGYRIYAGYTYSNSTIYIPPYLTNRVKAEVHAK